MELEVSPYTPEGPATNGLNTLNYLCETNHSSLRPPVPFSWNWIEPAERAGFDGVVSVNRDTFARYFREQLTPCVLANCYQPSVQVSMSGLTIRPNWDMRAVGKPTITMPPAGAQVLSYFYNASASDQAGLGGDMGSMTLSTTYSTTVTFTGATIVIAQHLVVFAQFRRLASSESWNVIDKTITDTYTLAVDQTGHLTSSVSSSTTDQSAPTPATNWFIEFFTGLNEFVDQIADKVQKLVSPSFGSFPINVAQLFVFPGGNTFAFKDVDFSDHQDLVSHITYVQV
jgi:hypothetical protein